MITPEKALAFTKCSVMLATVWPPDSKTDRFKTKTIDVLWFISVTCSLCLLIPLVNAIHCYRNNPLIVSKSICLICGITQSIMKTIVCRVHRKKIQFLLEELNDFLSKAKKNERALCESYVASNALFHVFVTICYYGATFFVISGPIFLPMVRLPTEAKYSFFNTNDDDIENNSIIVWCLCYAHQALVGFQTSASMSVDSLVAYLIWYTGVKAELLNRDFKLARNIVDLNECIRKHQRLLRYENVLVEAFRYVIFATVFAVTIGLAFSGIYLFSPQPIFVKGQFMVVSISAGIILYVTALPSDYLISTCKKLSDVAFESLWIGGNAGITRNWITIVQRSQKPVSIKIPGLIKEFSLKYYFNVLSNTFSYFTALHVILTKNKE